MKVSKQLPILIILFIHKSPIYCLEFEKNQKYSNNKFFILKLTIVSLIITNNDKKVHKFQ